MDEDFIKRLYEIYSVCNYNTGHLEDWPLNKFINWFKNAKYRDIIDTFCEIMKKYYKMFQHKFNNDVSNQLELLIQPESEDISNYYIAFEIIYKQFTSNSNG